MNSKPTQACPVANRMVGGFFAVALLAGTILQAGCSSDAGARPAPEGLAPVTGVVTLDDKPLPEATVLFIPVVAGAPDAQAVTDENGAFEASAGEGRAMGAAPGNYRIVISKLVMPDGSTATPDAEKSPMALMLEGAKEIVPPSYSDLVSSKLTATVPSGGGNLEFKLSSKGM